ncbi:MAG: hypothetical protein NC187_07065 [Candidatus Amulumruptor caecigallinarius]|nr:hypothetical protein [Candidatus Amulumruptor caecigallinarius]MCM1397228.1 hypothetical protein [Candidatus Amulumruptor caecigallinarius]MCM1454775.1 hypothetical protein [bacterium]
MTSITRRTLAVIVALVASLTGALSTDAQNNTTIGLGGGYISRNESGYAGIYLRHQFSRIVALQPQVDFAIRNRDKDAYIITVDAHLSVPLRTERWNVYGIAGAGFSSWNDPHTYADGKLVDRARHGALCADLGAGAALNVTPTLRLALEARANLAAARSCALVGLSIGYNF